MIIMQNTLIRAAALWLALAIPVAAQDIDRGTIFDQNKQTVVKVKVSGRDANGSPVSARTGSGIIVRPNGSL